MLRDDGLQQRGWVFVLAGAFAVLAMGCSDDLYADCQPDDDLGCTEESYSCTAEPDFQCSTQVCAKYQDGRTYCTKSCTNDDQCPNGKCERFILGSEENYCVPNSQLEDEGGGGGGGDAADVPGGGG